MAEKVKGLHARIAEVQHRLGAVSKSKQNPHFKSRYFDINLLLEQMKPILKEVGLVVMQPLSYRDGKAGILTVVSDADAPYSEEWFMPLPEGLDAQKLGGAITFFRRYALTSLFLVEGEVDDDGNTATGKAKETTSDDFSL